MPIQHDLDANPIHTPRPRQTATWLPILLLCITVGCGEYDGGGLDAGAGSGSSGSAGSGSSGSSSGSGGTGQAESIQAFGQTVLPMLQANCAECHSGAGPGSPSIAHSPASFGCVSDKAR